MANQVEDIVLRELAAPGERGRTGRPHLLGRLLHHRGGTIGVAILSVVTLLAIAAPLLAPADPNNQNLNIRLTHPFVRQAYPLGTDQLGRDIVSRLIYGCRIALIVGLTTVAIAGTVGILLGLLAGFYSGAIDDVISWFGNVFLAFPFIVLAVAVVAVFGSGLRNLIVVLSLTSWMSYMRVVRGEVLATREVSFVEAARAIGVDNWRLLFRHLLPNVLTPVIVIATFGVAEMIISEAALSFLGLGVGANTPSWGSMLADGRSYLFTSWWVATFPGIAISITVFAINLVGDWLRDELDPNMRGR